MSTIRLHDKEFSVYIPAEKIQTRVAEIAEQINKEYSGKRPLFIGVLNGAFLFTADLFKKIDIECEISFIRLASYEGMASTGQVKELVGLSSDIKDRHIIITEDIVDTGNTAVHLLKAIHKLQPASVKLATLLLKPKALKHELKVDFAGFEIPNDFIVGYGLDYDGIGRNLNDIYKLIS